MQAINLLQHKILCIFQWTSMLLDQNMESRIAIKTWGKEKRENEVRVLQLLRNSLTLSVFHTSCWVKNSAHVLLPSSKQLKDAQISSSEDDISPPPVLPLMLDFSPEKPVTEIEEKSKEAEVQNQLAEEQQTKEVRNENPFFYRTKTAWK